MQWPGFQDFEFGNNNTYKMVRSKEDCQYYPYTDRSPGSWLYVDPKDDHEHTVIFFHGLGENAGGYIGRFQEGGEAYASNQRAVVA